MAYEGVPNWEAHAEVRARTQMEAKVASPGSLAGIFQSLPVLRARQFSSSGIQAHVVGCLRRFSPSPRLPSRLLKASEAVLPCSPAAVADCREPQVRVLCLDLLRSVLPRLHPNPPSTTLT